MAIIFTNASYQNLTATSGTPGYLSYIGRLAAFDARLEKQLDFSISAMISSTQGYGCLTARRPNSPTSSGWLSRTIWRKCAASANSQTGSGFHRSESR